MRTRYDLIQPLSFGDPIYSGIATILLDPLQDRAVLGALEKEVLRARARMLELASKVYLAERIEVAAQQYHSL